MSIELSANAIARRDRVLLGLSAEDVKERRDYIGGSDANIILGNDSQKIIDLWKVKRGEQEPEDLSDVLAVQMGTYTEALNLFWASRQLDVTIKPPRIKQKAVEGRPHIKARPDGLILDYHIQDADGGPGLAVVDAKHTSGYYFSLDEYTAKHAPQLAVQMAAYGADRALLSILIGSNRWEHKYLERDRLYEDRVLNALDVFWEHVQDGTPPVDIPEVPSPIPHSLMKKVDMKSNNEWCSWEQDYLAHEDTAKAFESAKKQLKGLVGSDVKEAVGRFLAIRRDVKGALRFFKVKNA